MLAPAVFAVVGHDAAQVRAGTFATGNYIFPQNVTVTNNAIINGNVGIGTASPSRTFHIYTTNGQGILLESNVTGNAVLELQTHRTNGMTSVNFLTDAGGTDGQINYVPNNTTNGRAMQFYTAQSERMRIDSAGNVGIGATDVTTPLAGIGGLTINASSNYGGSGISLVDVNTNKYWLTYHYKNDNGYYFYYNNGASGLDVMTLKPSGNVGIGDTSPASPLTVGSSLEDASTIWVHVAGGKTYGIVVRQADNTGIWSAGATYDFYAAGTGTDYGTSSSVRWKRNITSIPNALDKVANMRGVYYDWDAAHGGKHGMGMIAEEVGAVVPEIVGWDPDAPGYATGMDYGHLTPVLVEAVKELKSQNDVLKAELCKKDASYSWC